MRQETARPSRRSGLRPRYRRHQTPTAQLIQAVQALIVQSRLVLERVERSLPLNPSSSSSSESTTTSRTNRQLGPFVEAPEPDYHPPPGLGPGATMAYASGVHDACHVFAPTLWPSISIMPRSNNPVDHGRSSPDPRPLPVDELASLYREFLDISCS